MTMTVIVLLVMTGWLLRGSIDSYFDCTEGCISRFFHEVAKGFNALMNRLPWNRS